MLLREKKNLIINKREDFKCPFCYTTYQLYLYTLLSPSGPREYRPDNFEDLKYVVKELDLEDFKFYSISVYTEMF